MGLSGGEAPWHKKNMAKQKILAKKQKTNLVSPQQACFIWRTADSSLAVLDFFLAHRAVPYVPCTSGHGLFAPRDYARSEIRLPDCEEKGVSRAEL